MNMKKTFILLSALALASAVLPSFAADLANGKRVYESYCLTCHGPYGISVTPGAPNFARGESLMQPDMVLLQSVKMGKMGQPPFFGILSDQDIFDSLAYARTLRK